MSGPFVTTRSPFFRALAAGLLASAALACSRTPAEPDPPPPAATSAPAAVVPLTWQVPPTWTAVDVPGGSGAKKAVYKIPKAGNDKEDGELVVLFFGTGAGGDPAKNFKEWFADFDGDVGAAARREELEVRGMKIETVDTKGTFKIAMGPKIGPNKKPPMQMVKEGFRLVAAVVKTPDRGNWFFKLTGPDETVQAAGSAFRSMLESVK